jgi:hypothetical protein
MKSRHHGWEEQLAQFNLHLIYRKGRLNIVPDALSRRPDHKPEPPPNLPVLAAVSSLAPDPNFLTAVREATSTDPYAQMVISRIMLADTEFATFSLDTGLLSNSDRLYVPPVPELRTQVMHTNHDCNISGHLGMDKTEELTSWSFFWPNMQQDVRHYVRSCEQCQRNKPSNRRPGGLLQPIPIPHKRWEQITMDLIVGLPKTARENSGIAVFVDRLSKEIKIPPISDDTTAAAIARVYFDNVFRHKGLSRVIIFDRDPRFTSNFWRTLFRLLGTNLSFSTAFHPETDGQTERVNRVIEEALRPYVNARHTDWDLFLTPVEFAYNNSSQASTGHSPFYLNTGQHPLTPGSLLKPSPFDVPAADNLAVAQNRQKQYADTRRRPLILQPGDKVYLSTAHLPLPGRTQVRKLAPKYTGPFIVQQVISDIAYRLELPDHMKLHPVFHVSQLKLYNPNDDQRFTGRQVPPPPPVITDQDPTYTVDQIKDHREVRRGNSTRTQYLVTFRDQPFHEARWVDSRLVQLAPSNEDVANVSGGG